MQNTFSRTLALLAAAVLVAPVLAFAQTPAATAAPTSTTTPAATTPIGKAGETAKSRAAQEISRRTDALNALNTRVQAMTRMSDSFKQALASNVQSQISLLAALKAKIDADTDLATLKTDVKTITDDYRIYRLVIPQGHISAMSDHIVNISLMLQALGTKLQARIQAAAAAGNDTTAATAALADLAKNIVAAQAQAKAAMDLILPLKPDEGDKATQQANDTALKAAHKDLQTAQQALVAVHKDIATIVQFLASAKTNANASSTAAH